MDISFALPYSLPRRRYCAGLEEVNEGAGEVQVLDVQHMFLFRGREHDNYL